MFNSKHMKTGEGRGYFLETMHCRWIYQCWPYEGTHQLPIWGVHANKRGLKSNVKSTFGVREWQQGKNSISGVGFIKTLKKARIMLFGTIHYSGPFCIMAQEIYDVTFGVLGIIDLIFGVQQKNSAMSPWIKSWWVPPWVLSIPVAPV